MPNNGSKYVNASLTSEAMEALRSLASQLYSAQIPTGSRYKSVSLSDALLYAISSVEEPRVLSDAGKELAHMVAAQIPKLMEGKGIAPDELDLFMSETARVLAGEPSEALSGPTTPDTSG
jgi:glycerol-3-phosphate dehydrogenase